MVRVPTPIVMNRISRLVDVGVDLEETLGPGRPRSFEALQGAVTEYFDWSADIAVALSRSFDDSSIVREYHAVPEPAIAIDDQSRAEVIRLLRTGVGVRVRWLAAVQERIE